MEQRAEDSDQHQLEDSDPETLLPPRKVAALIGIEESTLAAWRKRGGGPPWYRIRKHLIRYDKAEVLTWIHSQRYGEPESVHADQSETDRLRATAVRFQFPSEVAKTK
jgi:predicted DNA-binding transcriptional regulator AlpA